MSALEQEWMNQFKNLNETQRREALDFVRKLAQKEDARSRKFGEALDEAHRLREELTAKYGPNHFNVQADLDELREEASEWPPK